MNMLYVYFAIRYINNMHGILAFIYVYKNEYIVFVYKVVNLRVSCFFFGFVCFIFYIRHGTASKKKKHKQHERLLHQQPISHENKKKQNRKGRGSFCFSTAHKIYAAACYFSHSFFHLSICVALLELSLCVALFSFSLSVFLRFFLFCSLTSV